MTFVSFLCVHLFDIKITVTRCKISNLKSVLADGFSMEARSNFIFEGVQFERSF